MIHEVISLLDTTDNGGSSAIIIGLSDTGEKIPAAAGRISTQEGNATEIYDKSQDPVKNAKLIDKVTRSGHNSTIEHTVFNIAFRDVSVFAEQFLIEFRLASFTVKSRRYVDFGNSGYYVPCIGSEKEKEYKKTMDFLFDEYSSFLEAGIPKEDARFILPYCLRSNFFCTVNARELLHIIRAMLFGRGKQFKELNELGKQLFNQIEKLTPGICAEFFSRRTDEADEIYFGEEFDGFIAESDSTEEKTELLSYTSDAEKCVAGAALIASGKYSPKTVENILTDKNNVDEVIKKVVVSSRPRPLECINYTFRINGVSLSAITHFARHRMQSLLVPSLTNTDRSKYILPDTISLNNDILRRYKNAFAVMQKLYDNLKESGCSEEELVYCQLSGNTLDIVSSMNGRELLLFMKLRTCSRAQWEIREYAIDMLKKLRNVSPDIFCYYGPSCYVSSCPEGNLSCGKPNEIKEYFRNLR